MQEVDLRVGMLTAVFHRNVNTFVARGVLRWLCLRVARRWPVTFFIACLLHKAQLVSGHHEFVPGCCLYFVEERELQPIATNGTTARMRKSHWLPWREWGWPRCTPLTTKARAWGIVMRLFRRRIVLRGSILFVCCVSSKQAGYSSECCYYVLFLSASFLVGVFPGSETRLSLVCASRGRPEGRTTVVWWNDCEESNNTSAVTYWIEAMAEKCSYFYFCGTVLDVRHAYTWGRHAWT